MAKATTLRRRGYHGFSNRGSDEVKEEERGGNVEKQKDRTSITDLDSKHDGNAEDITKQRPVVEDVLETQLANLMIAGLASQQPGVCLFIRQLFFSGQTFFFLATI
jgi:hypothetical protein